MYEDRIKYVAFYCPLESNSENRLAVPSSVNKINYIISTLSRNDKKVEIVSPSWTLNVRGFYGKSKRTLTNDIDLTSFGTFGVTQRYLKTFSRVLTLIEFTYYMLMNTKENEVVIVYHSQVLSTPSRIVKALKGIKIILEVEENYSDTSISAFYKKLEWKIFKAADNIYFRQNY